MKKILLALLLIVVGYTTQAQNYQLHTVYIYSFIKYVHWPTQQAEGDFVIGVLGDSPILPHLNKMASAKKAGDRKIVIRQINGPGQAADVDLLFIPKQASEQIIAEAINVTSSGGVLTITEKEGLGSFGSNLNFVIRGGKLSFELNRASFEKSNLKVSSELSRLAIII